MEIRQTGSSTFLDKEHQEVAEWESGGAHLQVLAGDKPPVLGPTVLEKSLQLFLSLRGPGHRLLGHGSILTIGWLSHLLPATGAQLAALSGCSLSALHGALNLGTEEQGGGTVSPNRAQTPSPGGSLSPTGTRHGCRCLAAMSCKLLPQPSPAHHLI